MNQYQSLSLKSFYSSHNADHCLPLLFVRLLSDILDRHAVTRRCQGAPATCSNQCAVGSRDERLCDAPCYLVSYDRDVQAPDFRTGY